MKHGSLFTGIGGFELGLGAVWPVETAWQSDIDPFALELCKARFPGARQLGDVSKIEWDVKLHGIDVLTAGFPCQPASQAGKGLGELDERWLWPEVARCMRALRPELVILENVRGLRSKGLASVLVDLREMGYDAQWDLVPAAAVGAPHLRHRYWIVAYPKGTPMGHIFESAPPIFHWPAEKDFLPRLERNVPRRRERLTALGNAIVPQMATWLAMAIDRARHAGVLAAPSLFGKAVEDYAGRPPYTGLLIDGFVHEADTCSPKIVKGKNGRGLRLWPTPAANESEWSVEALAATVHADGSAAHDPHQRLYHPTTGQIVQRTLTNYVRGVEGGLWPEPPDLWPTPTAKDADNSRRHTTTTGQSNSGTTLLDAAIEAEELYPTPLAADGERSSAQGPRFYAGGGDNPTLREVARRQDEADELWPTTSASDHKGVSKPGQRRRQLEDRVREVETEELLPTPVASDGRRGSGRGAESTERGGGESLAAAAERLNGFIESNVEPPRPLEREDVERAIAQGPGGEPEELWPTPKASASGPDFARAGRRGDGDPDVKGTGSDLVTAVVQHELELWDTPTAAPWSHGGSGGELQAQVKGVQGEEIGGWSRDGVAPTDPGRSLNPTWEEWLMGYPKHWTAINVQETLA